MNHADQLIDTIIDLQIIADIMSALEDAAGNKCLKTDLLIRNLKQCVADADAASDALFAEMDMLKRQAA